VAASWQSLPRPLVENRQPAPSELRAWHLREAALCEEARLWHDVVAHLNPLVEADPTDLQLRLRRALAHAELGHRDAAQADYAVVGGSAPRLVVLDGFEGVSQNGREGRPLQMGAASYRRGISCRPMSQIPVFLPARARRFVAMIGVEREHPGDTSSAGAIFSVRAGGERFRSSLLREGEPALAVTVPLAGATALVLRVDRLPAPAPAVWANWADARVELDDGRILWLGDLPLYAADELTRLPPGGGNLPAAPGLSRRADPATAGGSAGALSAVAGPPVMNPDNGSYYQRVDGQYTWQAARGGGRDDLHGAPGTPGDRHLPAGERVHLVPARGRAAAEPLAGRLPGPGRPGFQRAGRRLALGDRRTMELDWLGSRRTEQHGRTRGLPRVLGVYRRPTRRLERSQQ
jgi:hypothetical protein